MAYSTLNTKIANIDQEDFFETTLKTAVTDATDTNIYLNTLPTPTEGFLTIDPTNTSKREVIFYNAKGADYVTVPSAAIGRGVSGTAQGHDVSSVVRLSDASKYFTFLRDRIISLNTGWIPADQSWAYASANTITVPSGATAIYSVGDKIKITQTTVKYFYVTAVANTTLTVTGGTDYTVANDAITSPYYSKAASPVGFPTYFNFNPSRAVSGGTAPTYTYHDLNIFWMNGRTVHGQIIWRNLSGGTAGNGANPLTFTPPVTMSSTKYNNSFAVFGNGNCYEVGGTIVGVSVKYVSSSTMGFASNASGIADITGNDQSSEGRHLNANFAYVV